MNQKEHHKRVDYLQEHEVLLKFYQQTIEKKEKRRKRAPTMCGSPLVLNNSNCATIHACGNFSAIFGDECQVGVYFIACPSVRFAPFCFVFASIYKTLKTSFLPNSLNTTTSVAKTNPHANFTSLPYLLVVFIELPENELIRLFIQEASL